MTTRRIRPAVLAAAACVLLAPAAGAATPAAKPHLSWVHCSGKGCPARGTILRGGTITLGGRGFKPGMRAVFRASTATRQRTVKTGYAGSKRLTALVPTNARSGRIYLTYKHGIRSNASGMLRVKSKPQPHSQPAGGGSPSGTAFDGTAMWIWNLPRSQGGNFSAIVAQAQAHGIRTVFVKSGDGINFWGQFSPELVQALHAGGLKVCAWQYVYGSDPNAESRVATQGVQAGADCFVIDAEKEYEGRYAQAQTYTRALRLAVGANYPIGLSSFPYVDYHPQLPYSEFLAPGGAQFNVPQVYWKTIGDSVDVAMDHTYRYNRPYVRAIVPVGQAYGGTSSSDIARFRQVAAAQQSTGLSWWDWESASSSNWDAVGAALGPFAGTPPSSEYALVTQGANNDLVRWAQEHLQSAGQQLKADGDFGPATETAVRNFQTANGLPVTGQLDTATWRALTGRYDPAPQTYPKRAKVSAAGPVPPARYEIPRVDGPHPVR
ncbi:MAG: hypothetical protein QOF37_3113 [Thermoleophilaceae bacterium]|jgi:hypothetical protein|nr:hypothetical protein [Thermoleophilaceae bacterium]